MADPNFDSGVYWPKEIGKAGVLATKSSSAVMYSLPEKTAAIDTPVLPSAMLPTCLKKGFNVCARDNVGSHQRVDDEDISSVYDDRVIHTVMVDMHPDDYKAIRGHPLSSLSFPATVTYITPASADGKLPFSRTTICDAEFAMKGRTSRFHQKPGYKLKFSKGNKLFGLRKLTLNGQSNDPSMSRSKFTQDLFRSMNVPAARVSMVYLIINGQKMGVYANVETIDEEFLQSRFGDFDSGNLYKLNSPVHLEALGSPEKYQALHSDSDGPVYELQTNEDKNDFSKLASVLNTLNDDRLQGEAFAQKVEETFEIDLYLRTFAVEVLAGHWDSLTYNGANAYLYEHPGSGKLLYIPYDTDNTFGVSWTEDMSQRNIFAFGRNQTCKLCEKMLNVERFKNIFVFYVKTLLSTVFKLDNTALPQRMQTTNRNLSKWAATDPTYARMFAAWAAVAERPKAAGVYFGRTFNNEMCVVQGAQCHHDAIHWVYYGLEGFVGARAQSAWNQVNAYPLKMDSLPVTVAFLPLSKADTLQVHVSTSCLQQNGQTCPFTVHASVTAAGSSTATQTQMGLTAEPGVYELTAPLIGSGTYQFLVNFQGKIVTAPVTPATYSTEKKKKKEKDAKTAVLLSFTPSADRNVLQLSQLVMNNQNGQADEAGELEAWVSIQVPSGGRAVKLCDYSLTALLEQDAPRLTLPCVTLPAGASVQIWLDGHTLQGPDHAPFAKEAVKSLYVLDEKGGVVDSLASFPKNFASDHVYRRSGNAWAMHCCDYQATPTVPSN